MKAQRYIYELINDDGSKTAKRRMTESAAAKANAKLEAAAELRAWYKVGKLGIPSVSKAAEPNPLGDLEQALKDSPVPKADKKERTNIKKQVNPKVQTGANKDAFGGRLGTRMSKINMEVINAGGAGVTVIAIAEKLKEPKGIVGAQLGWIFNHKNVKGLTRSEEGDTFRYTFKQ